MKTAILFLALCAVSCGQKDAPLPAELQLDFFQSQQILQQAQGPYQTALNAIVKFCKDEHDQVPVQDPANPRRLKCAPKPAPSKTDAKKEK